MKYAAIIAMLLYSSTCLSQTSARDLKIRGVRGDTLDFRFFDGRQVLIVNVASESEYSSQLDEMQQLYDMYRDSGLVVIAVPSDDFGKESRDDAGLSSLYGKYTFLVAAKTNVRGARITGIYRWLSDKSRNGKADERPARDFQKYLIDRKGELAASFSAKINPLSPIIIEAIRINN